MLVKNAVPRGEDASMEEVWEGVLWRMAVQAVPTLLSCLAFMSFSPLFFVSSIPFSLLFVTLSVLISVASWCWSPTEGGATTTTTTDNNKCKLGTRYFIAFHTLLLEDPWVSRKERKKEHTCAYIHT